jgi:cell division protein FtsB
MDAAAWHSVSDVCWGVGLGVIIGFLWVRGRGLYKTCEELKAQRDELIAMNTALWQGDRETAAAVLATARRRLGMTGRKAN